VRKKNLEFIKKNQNSEIIALEIPLLFETSAEKICDHTIFVGAPLAHRRERAFVREGWMKKLLIKLLTSKCLMKKRKHVLIL